MDGDIERALEAFPEVGIQKATPRIVFHAWLYETLTFFNYKNSAINSLFSFNMF